MAGLPPIQFLFIGSRLCSTLLSDLTSRFGPCASLSLHLHLVVKRTSTSKLSIMLGTQTRAAALSSRRFHFWNFEQRERALLLVVLRVGGRVGRPLLGQVFHGENGGHRTDRDAGAAIDALVGIDR